jgi:hypothetical protein
MTVYTERYISIPKNTGSFRQQVSTKVNRRS